MYKVGDINLLNFVDEESINYLDSLIETKPEEHLSLMAIITSSMLLYGRDGSYFKPEHTIYELGADYFSNPSEFTLWYYKDNFDDTKKSSAQGVLMRSYFNLLFTSYADCCYEKLKEHVLDNIRSL